MTCILAVGLTYTPALFTFPPWDLPGPRPPPITPHPSGRCPKIPQISKHGLGAKHRLPYLLRHRVEALMIHREIPGSRRSKMDLRWTRVALEKCESSTRVSESLFLCCVFRLEGHSFRGSSFIQKCPFLPTGYPKKNFPSEFSRWTLKNPFFFLTGPLQEILNF